MFGKIVVIAVRSSKPKLFERYLEDEPRSLREGEVTIDRHIFVRYLNCSNLQKYSLSSDVIELSNVKVMIDSDNPCIINAPTIILRNNRFRGYKHAFNITGKKIVMVNNEFEGPEQNHYIIGDSVLLTNNKYEGGVQIHEVAGYEVTAFNNVYEGRYRVNQYAGTNILVIDNESKGSPFDVVLEENDPNFMHRLYPNDLSNSETRSL
ncbi:unnamed protein product [Colias eurytheme]|nr:unnamed protein product [Colias eurytheme]